MKIERSSKISVLFKDIEEGDVFIDNDGNVCMKTELFSDSVNTITLDSGNLLYTENDIFVWLPKSVKLIVEE